MFLAGTIYAWSIISESISATFPSWNAQTLSMTFTVTMMVYALGGLVSGFLIKKTGPRPIMLAAAILYPCGMVIATLAQTPLQLYIGYGAMCGLATGLCYNSVVSTVSAWFPDRQGMVSGLLLAAYGLSSFITGKLFAAFAPADGGRAWGTGLRILALLFLAAVLTGAALFRFPEQNEIETGEHRLLLAVLHLGLAPDRCRTHPDRAGKRHRRGSGQKPVREYDRNSSGNDLDHERDRPHLQRDSL